MPIERRDGYRLWAGGPVPPGYDGITLGDLIIVRAECADDHALICHERVHVDQWRVFGAFGFARRYIGSYLMNRLRGHGHADAYLRIPLEVDARWNASQGRPSTSLTRKRMHPSKS